MENTSLVLAISKLAAAGEQAGFTLEQMIDLLDTGLEVETLLELICLRLNPAAMAPQSRSVSIPMGRVTTTIFSPWGSFRLLCSFS